MQFAKKSLGQNFLIDKNIIKKIINITLGLPYIRISPDHGVAKDIIGKNKADTTSLINCLKFINSF